MSKKFYGLKVGTTEIGLTTDVVDKTKEQLRNSSKKLKRIIRGNENNKNRRC